MSFNRELLCKWFKDGPCIWAFLFIFIAGWDLVTQNQVGPNSNFYASDSLKHGSEKEIFLFF